MYCVEVEALLQAIHLYQMLPCAPSYVYNKTLPPACVKAVTMHHVPNAVCCLLCRHPKVLALPHMGSSTEEVYKRLAGRLCDNIIRAREGGELLSRLV
jgi:lactate dehydrogenase-like 2-hydroxyacid dehydrogenase